MTNETTASQPKSIGDDALWARTEDIRLRFANPTSIPRSTLLHYAECLLAHLAILRATAAQASATIQAAPEGFRLVAIEPKPKSCDGNGFGNCCSEACAWKIEQGAYATIQEPVLVAEPVAYADPKAFENFTSGSAMNEWMWAKPAAGLVPIYRAAPMVADPAGVALPINATIRAVISKIAGDSGEGWCAKDEEDCWAELCAAATVKAVPSEALEAQANAIMGFARALVDMGFEPRDSIVKFAGECADLARTRKVLSADDFAAPLADKTGGGE